MRSIPLKPLVIGRHPSLTQGPPAAHGSEPCLNAHEPHNPVPLRTPPKAIPIPIAPDSLPNHSDRSRLRVRAFIRNATRAEDSGETKYEPGDADQEAGGKDQDRRSAR